MFVDDDRRFLGVNGNTEFLELPVIAGRLPAGTKDHQTGLHGSFDVALLQFYRHFAFGHVFDLGTKDDLHTDVFQVFLNGIGHVFVHELQQPSVLLDQNDLRLEVTIERGKFTAQHSLSHMMRGRRCVSELETKEYPADDDQRTRD